MPNRVMEFSICGMPYIGTKLREIAASLPSHSDVEIVLELEPPNVPQEGSQAARIKKTEKIFGEKVLPLRNAIKRLGGSTMFSLTTEGLFRITTKL